MRRESLKLGSAKQRGFTLIEVMVALIIVSLGIVSVIQVASQHVGNISELEKRMIASWVASNHISEIRYDAKIDKVKNGGKTQRYKLGGHEWRSRARLEETDVERVFLLTVEVTDGNGSQKRTYATMTSAVTDLL